MTYQTLVGIYDTAAHAQAAVTDLRSAGVPDGAVSVHTQAAATGLAGQRDPGFWAGLFGGAPDHGTEVYERSLQSGATVVTVQVPDAQVPHVTEILERHHPVDMDERTAGYGDATAAAPVASGQDVLQLAEEQLQVGKRVVNRGGTRIRRYVVETPVEQSVSLHDEAVTLERRPVTDGRAPTDSFADRTVELTATGEEAVVAKTARVYEEVGLRKEATERVETVRDTVRKEEVAVEQIPGEPTTPTAPAPLNKRA